MVESQADVSSLWPVFRMHPPLRATARPRESAALKVSQWGPEVASVLCIRLDNLGDVLMTEPAMRQLKCDVPGRHITLLAAPSGAAAAALLDVVDDVIVHRPSWMPGALGPDAPVDTERALIDTLRQRKFDAAVIFTVYSQSALPAAMLCHLAGIPRVLAHCRENPYGLVNHWIPEREPLDTLRHEVQRQVDLVSEVMVSHLAASLSSSTSTARSASGMRVTVDPQDHVDIERLLLRHDVDIESEMIVVHAGATAGSRCYPPERFGQAISKIVRRTGWPVLLTGSASEAPMVAEVKAAVADDIGHKVLDLSERLSFGQLAALLARATLLLSNNSGPVHLAAAAQTPVVVLYALTNPQHTPWQTPCRVLFDDVPCRWCYRSVCPEGHHACLLGVSADAVAEAVFDLIAETCDTA